MTPRLSVVVNFHDMRREAERTLFSLSPAYQRGVDASDYEVLAVDNGSSEPLDADLVRAWGGDGCRHLVHETDSPSPCRAINAAVEQTRGELVTCVIDGARILSPGILAASLAIARAFAHPFVYTLAMHLGPAPQGSSMQAGYDRQVEDELLASTGWRDDGYALFTVSAVAPSSGKGYLSRIVESGCYTVRRDDWLAAGGLCEEFEAPGGGLANHDIFKRFGERPEMTPVLLLGEATFHQFHGGVATNFTGPEHPFREFAAEYERIRGVPYSPPDGPPLLFGRVRPEAEWLLNPAE